MRVYQFASLPGDVRDLIGRCSRGVGPERAPVFESQRTLLQAAIVLGSILLIGASAPDLTRALAEVRVVVESEAMTMVGVLCLMSGTVGAFLGYYAGEVVGRTTHAWRESLVVLAPLVLCVRPTQVRVVLASAITKIDVLTIRGMSFRLSTDATLAIQGEPSLRVEFASQGDVQRFANALRKGDPASAAGMELANTLASITPSTTWTHKTPPGAKTGAAIGASLGVMLILAGLRW